MDWSARLDKLDPRLRSFLGICVAALLMMSPALTNGTPFFFGDTAHYLGLSRLLGSAEPQSAIVPLYSDPAYLESPQPLEVREKLLERAASYLGARSIFYSLFLGNAVDYLSVWGAMFLQCVFVAGAVWAFLRVIWGAISLWKFLALMLAMSWLTPLGVVSTTLMPDIFAAPLLLYITIAFVAWERLSVRARVWLGAGVATALLMHVTHPPVALLMAACGFVLGWMFGDGLRSSLKPAGFVLATIVVSSVLGGVAGSAANAHLGVELARPPFMMSRIIDDGPGRLYLQEHCADSTFEICRFAERILNNPDTASAGEYAVWDVSAEEGGVYQVEDVATRARLRAQAPAFAVAAAGAYPVQQAIESTKNFARQLVSFSLEGAGTTFWFSHDYWKQRVGWIGNNERQKLAPQWCVDNPSERCGWLQHTNLVPGFYVAVLASLVVFALAGFQFWSSHGLALSKLGGGERALLLALCGIVANALICSVLAGPYDRYANRIIWILPLIASAFVLWSPEKLTASLRALRAGRTPQA